MQEKLQESILKTLCYFDIFAIPLTKEELYNWLWMEKLGYADLRIKFTDFIRQIEQLHLEQKYGFYFLPGRGHIVENRLHSAAILEEKLNIAKRVAKKLRWIPFCRAMFVCNTVASAAASEDSDIDVFIVVRAGRMWLTRLFVTAVLSLFGLRRTKKKIKNKICLSFYVTDNHLDLEDIAIQQPDIYLAYWIDQLIPIYDPGDVRTEIMKANQWVKKYIPHALQDYVMLSRYRVQDCKLSKMKKKVLEAMWKGSYGDLLEKQAKGFQKKKMSRNYDSAKDEHNTKVIVSDTMLKFHENDRREYYRDEWLERCKDVIQNMEH